MEVVCISLVPACRARAVGLMRVFARVLRTQQYERCGDFLGARTDAQHTCTSHICYSVCCIYAHERTGSVDLFSELVLLKRNNRARPVYTFFTKTAGIFNTHIYKCRACTDFYCTILMGAQSKVIRTRSLYVSS